MTRHQTLTRKIALLMLILSALLIAARADHDRGFKQINLVSDQPGGAKYTDSYLLNPWGIAFRLGDLAVADNHAGVATFYDPSGRPDNLIIPIPSASDPNSLSSPTDFAFNEASLRGGKVFEVPVGSQKEPSVVIFVTEEGIIASWVPFFDTHQVVIAVDNSASGAVYKGVALARTRDGSFLYAANFHQGVVEMYDKDFGLLKTFTDTTVPVGFAPFGIRLIGGKLYVTFAKQEPPDNEDDEPGPGLGYVDIFNLNGDFVSRFASEGSLNAPWGLVVAPQDFGRFGGALLVGNFGDGRINAYNRRTGAFLGQLKDRRGHAIEIEGLWGLAVNPDADDDDDSDLYFTAGPDDEQHGLLGILRPEHN